MLGRPPGSTLFPSPTLCRSRTCENIVSEPSALSVTACSHTDVTCNHGADGTATAGTATNNVGTVTYLWSTDQNTSSLHSHTTLTYPLLLSNNCFTPTCQNIA